MCIWWKQRERKRKRETEKTKQFSKRKMHGREFFLCYTKHHKVSNHPSIHPLLIQNVRFFSLFLLNNYHFHRFVKNTLKKIYIISISCPSVSNYSVNARNWGNDRLLSQRIMLQCPWCEYRFALRCFLAAWRFVVTGLVSVAPCIWDSGNWPNI